MATWSELPLDAFHSLGSHVRGTPACSQQGGLAGARVRVCADVADPSSGLEPRCTCMSIHGCTSTCTHAHTHARRVRGPARTRGDCADAQVYHSECALECIDRPSSILAKYIPCPFAPSAPSVHMHACLPTCLQAQAGPRTCVCACLRSFVRACGRACVQQTGTHANTHTHMRARTRARTHARTHAPASARVSVLSCACPCLAMRWSAPSDQFGL